MEIVNIIVLIGMVASFIASIYLAHKHHLFTFEFYAPKWIKIITRVLAFVLCILTGLTSWLGFVVLALVFYIDKDF